MPRFASRLLPCALAGMLACLVAPAAAHNPSAVGGVLAPEPPQLSGLRCAADHPRGCPRGSLLRIDGEYLTRARTIVFLGGGRPQDDVSARATRASMHRLLVRVPATARSGPVRVISAATGRSRPSARLAVVATAPATAPRAASPSADGVFPVRGKHDYGTATNHFGGGRGHEGHDVFAACGVPVVAARGGEVTFSGWHGAAGHYVVITAEDGTSQAYMHLRSKPAHVKGDEVAAGDRIGEVGATGRASGCHLHFEWWTAPGWYRGGKAIDPLPHLKRWDAAS